MTSKIWHELVNIKYGEIYLTRYLSKQRTNKKRFKIATLIVSAQGIISWKYFEDYVWIAFALIAFIQLLLLIENYLIRSDKEIEEISNLRMMYTRYFNRLETLWSKYYCDQIEESEAIKEYFKHKRTHWEKIEEVDCRLDIKQRKKIEKASESDTNNYFNTYYSNG